MTPEEKQKKLEEILPGLVQGLTEDDVNNYIIAMIKEKIVMERRFQLLLDKFFEVVEAKTLLEQQLTRISPLLMAANSEEEK